MAKRDVFVIGALAGRVRAGTVNFCGDSPGFGGFSFIVQHVGSRSVLADVLGKRAALQSATAADGEAAKHGRAMSLEQADICSCREAGRLVESPSRDLHRPSVDALFRSAAKAYRSRVIAVVLSGNLYDGAAGACAVKECGGVVIVQDPRTAPYSLMPENALRAAQVDYCVRWRTSLVCW